VAKGKVATLMVWQAKSVHDVREQARLLGQQVNFRLRAFSGSLIGPATITCFAAKTD
jgi:hypothetical protein